jgi:CBS domain containing-hemolysin-like protein
MLTIQLLASQHVSAAAAAAACILRRYGVAIGSTLAPLVRVLMLLCAPITWPLSKVLDWVLGHENVAMKRQQLKAMVQLHGEGAGGFILCSLNTSCVH